MTAAFSTTSYTPDEIHAGDYPIASEEGEAGAAITKYDIVGRITASGKIVPSLAAAGDGSEVPIGIAAVDSGADTDPAIWYTSGGYDVAKVGLGDRTAAQAKVAFDRTPIELVDVK